MISNAEISLYNLCTQAHKYGYNHEIELVEPSLAIIRGKIGHKALETYYTARQSGSSVREAQKCMEDYLAVEFTTALGNDQAEIASVILDLINLLRRYVEHYHNEPYKIITVETILTAPMTDDIEFGIVVDLLVEYTSGSYRGDHAIVDHKFTGNFKSDDELRLDSQLPKYIKVGRANGFSVDRAVFNQIRTRPFKDPKPTDLFRRSTLEPTKAELTNIWQEAVDTAVEIRNDPKPPRRIFNSMVCKNCSFRDLCRTELNNQPVDRILETKYRKRERVLNIWKAESNA